MSEIAGLSSQEAKQKLKQFGFNELPNAKANSVWRIALEVIKEPMFILLLSCGGLYMLLGEYQEGIILIGWIFIIIFLTFYQNQKTEKALEALRELSSPRALVIRDGIEMRISGREVVPGDVLLVNEGDRIPADGEMIDGMNLNVDESLLTGESMPVHKQPKAQSEQAAKVFSGTLVVQGSGKILVGKTGVNTEFGKIGKSLQTIESQQTRLQKEMKILIRNLFIAGGVLSAAVVAGFYFTRGNFIQSLLNGLATAMAMLPEEFPVVLTVFLALGAWRLSKNNVLTRKPSAIETLGSATVLCSDKTGTITQNKMEVASLYTGDAFFRKDEFASNPLSVSSLLRTASLASHSNSIDPMEKAIDRALDSFGDAAATTEKLVREYPLGKELLAMTRVYAGEGDQGFIVNCKGAPEDIFTICKLENDLREKHFEAVQKLAEQGQRVIGVARGLWNEHALPDAQTGFQMEFLGLIGFEDPIRPEVPAAIQECHDAGIKVIMITGDYPSTARSIAMQAGLKADGLMLTGADLKSLPEAELREKIKLVNVFARIEPEQKLQIIRALKANGEVVAMTGDGVNDAPALKAADIGIAMGGKGTDVAREASSLVLLDDNFASIVSAIRSGRRIFDNLQKAMAYIIAIHIPIIGLTLLPAFFSELPILLLPLHIVFLEMIIDPVCSIAFESEQEEKGIMHRPPRDPEHQFFGIAKLLSSSLVGILLLGLVIGVYLLSYQEGHTDGEVRAIAFSSLILGNVFLILTFLSKTRSFIAVIMEKNKTVLGILALAIIILLLSLGIPYLQKIFAFEYPGFMHFYIAFAGSTIMLAVLETIKFFRQKRHSH